MDNREIKAGIIKKLGLFCSKAVSTEMYKLLANDIGHEDTAMILRSKESIELEDSLYKNLGVGDTLMSKIQSGRNIKMELVAEVARQRKSHIFKEYTDKKEEMSKILAQMANEFESEVDKELIDIKTIMLEEDKTFNVEPIENLLNEKFKIGNTSEKK